MQKHGYVQGEMRHWMQRSGDSCTHKKHITQFNSAFGMDSDSYQWSCKPNTPGACHRSHTLLRQQLIWTALYDDIRVTWEKDANAHSKARCFREPQLPTLRKLKITLQTETAHSLTIMFRYSRHCNCGCQNSVCKWRYIWMKVGLRLWDRSLAKVPQNNLRWYQKVERNQSFFARHWGCFSVAALKDP